MDKKTLLFYYFTNCNFDLIAQEFLMGKNRQHADRLFDALELELAKEAGKEEGQIGKKARSQIIAMAKKRGKTIEAMLEEVKPALFETARRAKEIQFPTVH